MLVGEGISNDNMALNKKSSDPKNESNDEEDEDYGDFDANELLNLTDYQNKRKQS